MQSSMSMSMSVYGEVGKLYARCGGAFGIATLVDECMDSWMNDPTLNANEAVATWHQSMKRCGFKYLTTQLLCERAGGPQQYTGLPMNVAHKHLNINGVEWGTFMEIFKRVCENRKLDKETVLELCGLLACNEDEIVVQPGQAPAAEAPGNSQRRLSQTSFYGRLGGVYPLSLFAHRLIDAMLADERVDLPENDAAPLTFLFTELVCHVTGGPGGLTCPLLNLPQNAWDIFVGTAYVAADYLSSDLRAQLLQSLQNSRQLIVDPDTPQADPATGNIKPARVLPLDLAATGAKLSTAALEERRAASGKHVASRKRVFGDPRTLYGRLGGIFALAKVSSHLMDVWMQNPNLNANAMVARWHESNQNSGFKFLVTQILGYLTGGPQRYTGRSMELAHKHLSITSAQWDHFMNDADQVLLDLDVDPDVHAKLRNVLASFRSQCVLPPGVTAAPDPGLSKPCSCTEDSPLFFRLGGVYLIAHFVDELCELVFHGQEVHVELSDTRHPPGLKYMVTELLCHCTGGPEVVTSEGFDDAKLGVVPEEWDSFRCLAREAASKFWTDQKIQEELLSCLEATKHEICRSDGAPVLCISSPVSPPLSPKSPVRPAVMLQAESPRCPFAAQTQSSAGEASGSASESASQTLPLQNRRDRRRATCPVLGHLPNLLEGRLLGNESQAKLDSLFEEDPDICCPISLLLFVEPTKASDGFVYEKSSVDMLSRSHGRSPMSRQTLDRHACTPDMTKKIQAFSFRRERSEELLTFAEALDLKTDTSIIRASLERVGEYVSVLRKHQGDVESQDASAKMQEALGLQDVVSRAAHLWEALQEPVPPELKLTGSHRARSAKAAAKQVRGKHAGKATSPPARTSNHARQRAPSRTQDVQSFLSALTTHELVEQMAQKLYERFQGRLCRLGEDVLDLLEDKFGVPDHLQTLIWRRLREAIFRSRCQHVELANAAGEVLPDVQVSKEEWLDAFQTWLNTVRARCGQAKLTRHDFNFELQGMQKKTFHEDYFQGTKLGEGAFGQVYLMMHKKLNTERVIKLIDKEHLAGNHESIEAEFKVMTDLDHPYIVRVYETFAIDGDLHIVMDYAAGGDLDAILKGLQKAGEGKEVLPEPFTRTAMLQATAALQYMHSKGVIHCDLKPGNCMLLQEVDVENGELPHLLLADFGLSEICSQFGPSSGARVKGTPLYLSPEGFEGHLSEKSDMWALGVMAFEMLTGHRPFQHSGASIFMLWNKVARTEPPLEDVLGEVQREVVAALLRKSPSERPTAKECREMVWLSEREAVPSVLEAVEGRRRVSCLGQKSYFHRVAMFCIATELSMSDVPQLFEVFKSLDTERTGRIKQAQLAEGLQLLGIARDPEELMNIMDLDQNGFVSYTEFLAGAMSWANDISDGMLEQTFRMFDLDGDGVISKHELHSMLSGSGPLVEVLPDGSTVDEVMEEISNGEGAITFEAFKAALKEDRLSEPIPVNIGGISIEKARCRKSILEELDNPAVCSLLDNEVEVEVEPVLAAASAAGTAPSALPPLHDWLLEVFEGPSGAQHEALRRFLAFPQDLPPVHELPGLCRHFLAGFCLARQLLERQAEAESAAEDVLRAVDAEALRLATNLQAEQLLPRTASNGND